jgi:hypothetical protein
MRKSLLSLFTGRLDDYSLMHLSGEPLLRFFNHSRDLGVQQLQENRAALSSVPLIDAGEVVRTLESTVRDGDHE